MKYLTPLLAIAVSFTNPQSICNSLTSSVPDCGLSCIYPVGSQVSCATTNYNCLCSRAISASSIRSSAGNCIISACGATALQVLTGAKAVCSCASANTALATSAINTSTSFAVSGMTSSASPTSLVSMMPVRSTGTQVPTASEARSVSSTSRLMQGSSASSVGGASSPEALSTLSASGTTVQMSFNWQGAMRPAVGWVEGLVLAGLDLVKLL